MSGTGRVSPAMKVLQLDMTQPAHHYSQIKGMRRRDSNSNTKDIQQRFEEYTELKPGQSCWTYWGKYILYLRASVVDILKSPQLD